MLKVFGFFWKAFTYIFVMAFEAHATVLRNVLPRDVIKPKILKDKTTKYFDGF